MKIRKWKSILLKITLVAVLLAILVPLFLYFGSLDWSKKHSTRVAALPLYTAGIDSGEYRLAVDNSYEFLVRAKGMKNQGENVILLHGFPESSIMWEALASRLAQEGYHVLAFDQRGFSPQARPNEVAEYHITKLVKDVIDIADKVGFQQFHLIGHDWGAAVGWNAVMDFPERITSWTAMSIPHIGVFMNGVLSDSLQKQRSGYFQFFQSAYLPEFMFMHSGQKNLKKMLASLPQKHQDEYLSILAESGALTAELNWYRAMNVEELVKSKILDKSITRPTLFIWGTKDGVIAPTVIAKQKEYIQAPYKELSLDAGHALMQEEENAVINIILAHLREN